jgi:uncharacterized SAM-dependent methyltransferase
MLDLVESKLSQHEAFRADVLAGLSQRQKTLPSRWLYDQQARSCLRKSLTSTNIT